jgi:NADH-quinone oxidoreductase subunit G
MASQQLFAAVPFYAGLTLDEIGGRGVRWQEREAAGAWPAAGEAAGPPQPPATGVGGDVVDGRLRLGTYRSIWWGPEVAASPALQFVRVRPRVELSPADAQRLELFDGDKVDVSADGATLSAVVSVRAAVPAGSAFVEGNAIDGPLADVRKAPSARVREPAVVGATLPPEHEEPVADTPQDTFPTQTDVRRQSP